ncbi:MAG: metallopeptidase [Candidatus Verstraetearchaeota archaeon]|nr:metallopeptidase [Candidatus Verstraetearchaeota archaeon]
MKRVKYTSAEDIAAIAKRLVETLNLAYIDLQRVHFVRSYGSKSLAHARIHALPRIWREILRLPPQYVIEVISENFDELPREAKEKVVLHELLHIPPSFSGSLRPHKPYVTRGAVEKLYKLFLKRFSQNLRD